MKKTFLFASLIAMFAIVATSCDKKNEGGEAPKARFTYAVDGLVVTFTNASKDAQTYAWDFGDGSEISAEENPVHTYAAAGNYTVVLTAKNAAGENKMTENLVLAEKALEIKIDGDFSDWEAAPAALIAKAETNEDTKYEYLYAMKWCTDADYIYFFLEFNAETYEYLDKETGEAAEGFLVEPIDIYMNVDGSQETGSNNYLWDNSAADVLIEGFWANQFEDAGVYIFPADADQAAWAWTDAEVVGSTTTCEAQILANGHRAIEGKIMMAMLPVEVKGLKVGVFTSNTEWSESGVLPQTTINDDGTSTPSPLLEVKLNR